MGFFATRSRAGAAHAPWPRSAAVDRMGVPPRFRAVRDALTTGHGSVEACAVLGHELAQDGASLDECLEGLRLTAVTVSSAAPSFEDVRAMSVAWSETTLGFLHQISCEEPLTGLATLAHVRSRLSELHRRADVCEVPPVRDEFALVVLELEHGGNAVLRSGSEDTWTRSMRMAQLGRVARTVFPTTETIGRLGLHRIVVVAGRDVRLGRRVALVRRLAALDDEAGARAWIEGLPSSDQATASLLDELARG